MSRPSFRILFRIFFQKWFISVACYGKPFGGEETLQGSSLERAELSGVSNLIIEGLDCTLHVKTSLKTFRSLKIDLNTWLSLSLEK